MIGDLKIDFDDSSGGIKVQFETFKGDASGSMFPGKEGQRDRLILRVSIILRVI